MPESDVLLRCGEVPMFKGKVGRRGHHIAIRLDRLVSHEEDKE
jgi:flagellar motor switch protein FliM